MARVQNIVGVLTRQHTGGFMKKLAVIFYVPTTSTTAGYCWKWRTVDGKTNSDGSFIYYYDCITHARASGYGVQAVCARGEIAPSRGSLTPHSDRRFAAKQEL